VKSLNAIVEKLAQSQRGFLFAADAVPAERWKARPGDNRWSAGELAGHLMIVERRIISRADHLLQEPAKRRPFLKRFHVPMAVVEARLFRRISPIPVDSETIREKEEMLSELREVRERTLAFIGETRGRDLSQYCMPHPFLGTLTAYEWFQFIASHEIRHTKQMAEIAAALPKNITKLQK
jgi:uncharacterized damage-inducible protein DinB